MTATPTSLLRIIGTSDVHAHVYPFDYYRNAEWLVGGLARAAGVINELRSQAPLSLVVDSGDFLFGSPLTDHQAGLSPKDGVIDPMIGAMNAVGYDIVTLGNHEFDHGFDVLRDAIAELDCPIVSSNLMIEADDPEDDPEWVERWHILHRNVPGGDQPLKIGVIGFLPPQTATWNNGHFGQKIRVDDIIPVARDVVAEVRAAGADVVVALCHSGLGRAKVDTGEENAATALAKIAGIDAIVAGHAHLTLPGPDYEGLEGVDAAAGAICGVPTVMPGCFGAQVATIDLSLTYDNGWSVAAHQAVCHSVKGSPHPGAPAVLDAAAAGHVRILTHLQQVVAQAPRHLHSYFALAGDSPSVDLVAAAKRWWVETALRGTTYEGLPVLGTASPNRAGGRSGAHNYIDIPKGPINRAQLVSLQHFPNRIAALEVTGQVVHDWLERAAAVFNHLPPGVSDVPLHNALAPPFHFDTVTGLRYAIDLSKPARYDPFGVLSDPAASRIVDLTLDGTPLDRDARLILAVSNFRAGGGGAFPHPAGPGILPHLSTPVLDVVTAYLNQTDGTADIPATPWRFARIDGATAVLDISADAIPYLDTVPHLGLTPLRDIGDGYWRFSINLDGLQDAAETHT